MKRITYLLLVCLLLACSVPAARGAFSWANENQGVTQGLTIRYERWIVNDADAASLALAETWAGYATFEYGSSVSEDNWTEAYDGRFGEFESGVHYLVVPILESIDEWAVEDC